MSKLSKAQMHQRPTYETLVRDTILEPKDKIALPDREATILRKSQQLSRYDDSEFLDLEKDNEKIKQEQIRQATINTAAGNDNGGSIGQTRAQQPGPHQGHNFTQPPPPQPPSSGPMQFNTQGGQGQPPHAPLQTHSTTSGPPPPPSRGAKKIAQQIFKQTGQRPEVFEMAASDAMQEAANETARVLAENERARAAKSSAVAQQIANHMGPNSSADPSYIARLTQLEMKKRAKPRTRGQGEDEDMAAMPQQPPPPPPGAGGQTVMSARTKERQRIKKATKAARPIIIRQGVKQSEDAPMHLILQPQPPIPAPMPTQPPPQPPGGGKPGIKKGTTKDALLLERVRAKTRIRGKSTPPPMTPKVDVPSGPDKFVTSPIESNIVNANDIVHVLHA